MKTKNDPLSDGSARGALLAVITLAATHAAFGTPIPVGSFTSGNLIDFETAPSGNIGSFYPGLTFQNMDGGTVLDVGTGEGASRTAANFFSTPGFPPGVIVWDSPIIRAGFYITTSVGDNTTVSARFFSGDVVVGSEFFTTGGGGSGGSFAGIEFLTGFDKIIIDPANIAVGAFAIDGLRWDPASSKAPDGGSTLALLGLTLSGMLAVRRKQKAA